jgi:hypothetical protein
LFDQEEWSYAQQPTAKLLETLWREGLRGGPNFITWFRKHVSIATLTILFI